MKEKVNPNQVSETGDVKKPETEAIQKESILLQWQAPEFSLYRRNWLYYGLIILVFLTIVGYSIYTRDWFIIAIAILLLGFLFWYQTLKPSTTTYKITQLGFYVNERIYQYNEVHSFWVLVNQKENKLNLLFNKKYLPQLSVILKGIDPLTIKTILGKYIPEQENRTESLVDKLMRLLKL